MIEVIPLLNGQAENEGRLSPKFKAHSLPSPASHSALLLKVIPSFHSSEESGELVLAHSQFYSSTLPIKGKKTEQAVQAHSAPVTLAVLCFLKCKLWWVGRELYF